MTTVTNLNKLRKIEDLNHHDDLSLKRAKSDDTLTSGDETSSERTDDRLDKMAAAFRTIIEVRLQRLVNAYLFT